MNKWYKLSIMMFLMGGMLGQLGSSMVINTVASGCAIISFSAFITGFINRGDNDE